MATHRNCGERDAANPKAEDKIKWETNIQASSLQEEQRTSIYVYDDDGVGEESLKHTLLMFNTLYSTDYAIKTIKSNEVIVGNWITNAALFVMPGGADLPYVKKLNGEGNNVIKNFVQNGGSYLGFCAGAYYASGYVEFDKGGELEVLGKRELAFFPDKSVGPILAKYNYKNKSGARSALIEISLEGFSAVNIYFNGGGYFSNAKNYSNVSIIGSYKISDSSKSPAMIYIKYGQGNVILTGVHFECDPFLLDVDDPFLQEIIPKLKKDNSTRQLLVKKLLRKLNISC